MEGFTTDEEHKMNALYTVLAAIIVKYIVDGIKALGGWMRRSGEKDMEKAFDKLKNIVEK